MSCDDITDIVIEALEVFVNHILYTRELYPQQIFKKRRVYNAPVYVSIFSPLNSYIHNVLQAARCLQQSGELHCVILQFYHDEVTLNECYKFNIKQLQHSIEIQEREDKFLIDFEQELRGSLYKLAERVKPLEKLPKGSKFRILLNTTQESFVKFSHNPKYQDFPWLCDDQKLEHSQHVISLLPLTRIDSIGLVLDLEVF